MLWCALTIQMANACKVTLYRYYSNCQKYLHSCVVAIADFVLDAPFAVKTCTSYLVPGLSTGVMYCLCVVI